MELQKISDMSNQPYTALLYCAPGVGKSTAIGLIAEASEGNTLVFDVDRTISRTLAKGEVVKDTSKVIVCQIENRGKDMNKGIDGTFDNWKTAIGELTPDFIKENNITTIAVDNISELERCMLSDFGRQGKNKGIPTMGDYQTMQFMLVNSLRQMKALGVNIIWTAWEDVRQITNPDGSQYSQLVPKVSYKIVDNICGLCDVVGKIIINPETKGHGILLQAQQNIYAKNQIDSRVACSVSDFVKWEFNKKETKK